MAESTMMQAIRRFRTASREHQEATRTAAELFKQHQDALDRVRKADAEVNKARQEMCTVILERGA